jgi:multimeric flavodoxin WrbA
MELKPLGKLYDIQHSGYFRLSGKQRQCQNFAESGKCCSIKDDAQAVFEKADMIFLASPVYFMRTSAMMAA